MNIMMEFAGKHVLIIVENLPVPFDRRVWQEAKALKENGAFVSVICPAIRGYEKKFETIRGIDVYRHPLPVEARGALGYLLEYGVAIFFECWLSWKIFFKKRFHVIHGCNPPDLIFLVALPFKLFGVKYVFDHHDINPELYIAKFGHKGIFYRMMVFFEKLTFRVADFSIATNDSYREIALHRGGMDPEKVAVVRSGADLSRVRLQDPKEEYRRGKKYLVGYVGVIGEQEGLDLLVDSVSVMKERGHDVHFAILGGGTDLDKVKAYARKKGVDDIMEFFGRVDDDIMMDVLNTCDVCVNPDRPTEMNNLSTMNKIIEYMALRKPIVQYDLKEGRFSSADASLYAVNTEPADFADKIIYLLENPALRVQMAETGYQRVLNGLSWDHQKLYLIDFYRKVFGLK